MRCLKVLGLAALATVGLSALFGTGAASATELYKYTTPSANDTIGVGSEVVMSLESGTSLLLKDTLGGANDTCTSSEIKGKVETAGSSTTNPGGKISTLTFGGCSHTTHVLFGGWLDVIYIAGTTNATLIIRETRWIIVSTIFGISCTVNAGAGTAIGTVTGAKSSTGNATLDVNGVVTLENGCGDSTLTGSYLITSPTGLTVEAS